MEYRAITKENFYLKEIKNTCRLILKNPEITSENLKLSLKENDYLEASSEENFKTKFMSVNKRISILTPNLQKFLIEKNVDNSSFINLYSILSVERIIAEFMDEVIKNKYYNFDYNVHEKDFREFILSKEEQSEKVNNWSETSKKKILTRIKTFLTKAGFLKKEKNGSFKIIKPIISEDIITEIKENGNNEILKIMLY